MTNEIDEFTQSVLTNNPYTVDTRQSTPAENGWREPDDSVALFWFDPTETQTTVPRVSVFRETEPGRWRYEEWKLGLDQDSMGAFEEIDARLIGQTERSRLLVTDKQYRENVSE